MELTNLTIWGRRAALNVQKVIWCANELGLAFEQIDAGQHYGKTKEPFFLQMNPNGKVPVLQIGQFTLWESHAILRFMYTHGCGPRLPQLTESEIAHSDQWLDWISCTLYYPAFRNYYLYQTRTPDTEKDAAKINSMRSEVSDLFQILEAQLSRHEFVAGPQLTPADFSIGVVVNKWLRIDGNLIDVPQINRYHNALISRPCFAKDVHAYALNAV